MEWFSCYPQWHFQYQTHKTDPMMVLPCCFILIAFPNLLLVLLAPQSFVEAKNVKQVYTDQQCGTSSVEPIITPPRTSVLLQEGYPAVPHSWPWIVSIQYKDFGIGCAWKHVCTGTLISSRVVMTNGACFFESKNNGTTLADTRSRSPYNWLVVLGSHNNSVMANVDTSVTVESFKEFREIYNSAIYYALLITLTNDFPESPYINNICVRKKRFPVGYQCFMAGWKEKEKKMSTLCVGKGKQNNFICKCIGVNCIKQNMEKEMNKLMEKNDGNLTQMRLRLVSRDEYMEQTGNYLTFDQVAAPGMDSQIASSAVHVPLCIL